MPNPSRPKTPCCSTRPVCKTKLRYLEDVRRVVLPLLFLLLSACQPQKPKEITDLRSFNYQGGDVRSGSIQYDASPPAGGPYNALWQTCATYTAPIYDEYAVHSLARGAIWVTYRSGLAPTELEKLKAVLATPIKIRKGDQDVDIQAKVLMSPREGLPAPLVMTAWNAQITAQTADDERLTLFMEQFGAGDRVPEAGASCAGGFTGTR